MERAALIRIVFLLLACLSLAQAQTSGSDINLDRLTRAVSAINDNQLPQAEELLNAVLATSRNDADALNLLGVVRAKQERVADAERLFRRALASLPSHVGAHINLAELLLTHNRSVEAMPILLSAYKLAPARPEINLNLATLYVAKRDYAQAYEHLRQVPPEAFNDDYYLLMSRTLIGLNRPEEALNILSNARQDSFPIVYALGIVNAALKRYDKADEYLSSALTLKRDDVATLRALARVARATGNLEKALSHLVQARRLAPESPAVLYDFGVTTLQMGLVLDALPVFERLHRDYAREPAYLYGLAAAHWTKGEVAETTRLMNSYVTLQPRDASGWYLLGAALLRQERTSEAQAALQKSLSLKPDPDTDYLLGTSFEKAGNRAAAIDTYRRVVQSSPNHAAAHAALGAAYRELGNFPEARTELERAVELDANDLRANYQLGLVYAKLGQAEAARKMFDRADELRKRQHEQERVILKLIDEPQP